MIAVNGIKNSCDFSKKKLPTVPETILKRRKEKSERREKQLKAQLIEKKVAVAIVQVMDLFFRT